MTGFDLLRPRLLPRASTTSRPADDAGRLIEDSTNTTMWFLLVARRASIAAGDESHEVL
jgi:hypothetical protein